MNELRLQQWRIERLRAAIDKITDGNRTTFARKMGYKDGAFVRQMLSGDRAVTEKTIRIIEKLPGMGGWFDPAPRPKADEEQLSSGDTVSEAQTFPDTGEHPDAPILDAQQVDEFILELKQAFQTGALTVTRFALLHGLLREGQESLASNFTREKQAIGGRGSGKGRKRQTG